MYLRWLRSTIVKDTFRGPNLQNSRYTHKSSKILNLPQKGHPVKLFFNGSVVIKLSVLSDLSDICTFGPILKALLQEQMSDRSLKNLLYNIDHKILNIPPTEKYDLSLDLSDCEEYEFSIYYNIGILELYHKIHSNKKCVVSVRRSYWKCYWMSGMILNNLMTTNGFKNCVQSVSHNIWSSTRGIGTGGQEGGGVSGQEYCPPPNNWHCLGDFAFNVRGGPRYNTIYSYRFWHVTVQPSTLPILLIFLQLLELHWLSPISF